MSVMSMSLEKSIADVTARLDALHRSPGGMDRAAVERDVLGTIGAD